MNTESVSLSIMKLTPIFCSLSRGLSLSEGKDIHRDIPACTRGSATGYCDCSL